MPRITDTAEEFLDGTSSIEEADNCNINKTFICTLTGEMVDSKTDEELKICSEEFSDLSIDCSEECDTIKLISNVESKSSNLKSLSIVTESEFLNEGESSDGSSIPLKEFDHCTICDPDMVQENIEIIECDNILCGTVLKKTSDEGEGNYITCEKSTPTVEESEQNGIEIKNLSTIHGKIVPLKLENQIANQTLQIPCYLNRPNITEDISKLSKLNDPDYEKTDETVEECATEVVEGKICQYKFADATSSMSGSFNNKIKQPRGIFQPSQKPEMRRNIPQSSENVSDQTFEAVEEFFPKSEVPGLEEENSRSRKPEVRGNPPQIFENASDQTFKAEEFNPKQVACSKLSRVFNKSSNQFSEPSDPQLQTPATSDNSSSVSEILKSEMNTSSTVIQQSAVETLEHQSQTAISRNISDRRNMKTIQLTEVLKFLKKITSIVDDIGVMNNSLIKTVDAFFKLQQSLQELINITHQYLVHIDFLPSSVILVENEYTLGKINFNVKLFGEDIFKNLKGMKKDLNKAFREITAFQKDFMYVSKKLCSVPFELTEDHEMRNTLHKTVGIHSKVCCVYDIRERLEFFKDKIGSETLSEVSRVKEFGNYLDILKENPCSERLV